MCTEASTDIITDVVIKKKQQQTNQKLFIKASDTSVWSAKQHKSIYTSLQKSVQSCMCAIIKLDSIYTSQCR